MRLDQDESQAYGADDNYASALELPAHWLRAQDLLLEALPDDLRLNVFGAIIP